VSWSDRRYDDLAPTLNSRARRGSRSPTSIRAPFRCEQADQESVAVLADGDLDIGFGSNAKQSLANGYRLLGCIEPDFEL
jgi:hypothetical protein